MHGPIQVSRRLTVTHYGDGEVELVLDSGSTYAPDEVHCLTREEADKLIEALKRPEHDDA